MQSDFCDLRGVRFEGVTVANAREGTRLPHPPPPASSIPPPARVSRAHAEVYKPLLWGFFFFFFCSRMCAVVAPYAKKLTLNKTLKMSFFNPCSFTSTPGHLKRLLAIVFRLH